MLMQMFICCFVCTGFINSLLSWSAFVPLSRLTYTAYLLHPLVMSFCYLNRDTLLYITGITMVMLSVCTSLVVIV